MTDYIEVPELRHSCQMCVGEHSQCEYLPPCQGIIFIRPEDLPEYHVRFIADRLENP